MVSGRIPNNRHMCNVRGVLPTWHNRGVTLALAEYKAVGEITNLDSAAMTFRIGNLIVDYGDAPVDPRLRVRQPDRRTQRLRDVDRDHERSARYRLPGAGKKAEQLGGYLPRALAYLVD